ncbi:MAG: hypothetical protein IBJ13_13475, partial [Sphingopyxis sp.]|nr:hypothetical protein [Sphingopyxis sp.]
LAAALLPWGILAALIVAVWRSRFMVAVRKQMREKPGASDPAAPPAG